MRTIGLKSAATNDGVSVVVMGESEQPPSPERLCDVLTEGTREEVETDLTRLDAATADVRKRALQAVRRVAEERPAEFEELTASFARFLTDDDRAVRLTTAKLFVTLAQSIPRSVLPAIDALTDRLTDDEEFYYVRGRCAEAFGYLAVDSPAEVIDPETLADLRIGLSFAEPEVKKKLAKALTLVALGDPSRLRHQVASLADHLDDESELIRYHLCTTLVVIGCAHPSNLANTEDQLRERLTDDSPFVRGRAAEALGVLAESDIEVGPVLDSDGLDSGGDEAPSFLTDRLRFCRHHVAEEATGSAPTGIGTVESVRSGTDEVVEKISLPQEGECPHCGLPLPNSGQLMCPRCRAPR